MFLDHAPPKGVCSPEVRIGSSQWLHDELPVRLAHRLRDFHRLPYSGLCDTHLHRVYKFYLHAFQDLVSFPPIRELEDEEMFATLIDSQLQQGSFLVDDIKLARRSLSIRPLLDQEVIDSFIDRLLSTRIGNRLLAEHVLAIRSSTFRDGMVNPNCSVPEITETVVEELRERCVGVHGRAPEIKLRTDGSGAGVLAYIPEHIRVIVVVLLRNALRATCERHALESELPPVAVDIRRGDFDVVIRIADHGGGLSPEVQKKVFSWGFTTADDMVPQDWAGTGFGLPIARLYSQYFGGDLYLQSMRGLGTDV
eukprot:gnl/MRDRNA2_/MRDRNA2_335653_c0_seq1.p1 gnl/MRDRNA2_/MRDRNA2_335653_c0~~gnl/MRDRNA2_/MRDRNA2_335653_c0_seq1.p1  ORF type:complete len:309 (-),score=41.63 gnl/MRDRNA2_/MRDRNA2_335653_c0_seq1:27-953(-)